MDLEVRHLQLVAAVADMGSLTRAGDRLHLTQSALSHQLRGIESRLGAALFLRVGKRLVLTPAGERLLASAKDILERLAQAEEDIRRMGKEHAGVLRITTECYTCYHWLPPLLMRYRRKFPRVEVRIDVEATRAPIADAAGRQDRSGHRQHDGDATGAWSSRKVFEDEVVLIAARASPLRAAAARPHHRDARRDAVHLSAAGRKAGCCRRCCCRPACRRGSRKCS